MNSYGSKKRVFCYIFLLCLSSCAHLSRRTPSFPACPEPILLSHQDPLMFPYLSLFSPFPLPLFLSDTTWASYQTEPEIRPSHWPSHSSSQHETRKPFELLVWRTVFTSETGYSVRKTYPTLLLIDYNAHVLFTTRPGICIMEVDFMNTVSCPYRL